MDVIERIEALEKDTRMLRGALRRWQVAACAVAGAALLLIPLRAGLARGRQDEEKVISARAISIVDEKGKQRAALGTHEDGVALVLSDTKGKHRLILAVHPDGTAAFTATDKAEKPRTVIGTDENGDAVVGTIDKDGKEHDLTGD